MEGFPWGHGQIMEGFPLGHRNLMEDDLINNPGWNQRLTTAAIEGNLEKLKLCLDNRADLQYRRYGRTPFMFAVSNEHFEMTQFLLEYGCSANTKDLDGMTVLMLAVLKGNLEITNLLIDRKCNIDAKTNYGDTALMMAAEHGYLKITQLLLDSGCDIDAQSRDGRSAINFAAKFGHYNVTRLLLDRNCNKEIRDEDGCTSFALAAKNGHYDIMRLLIERGCDTETKNRDGKTASSLARNHGHFFEEEERVKQIQKILKEEPNISTVHQGNIETTDSDQKDKHSAMLNRLLGNGTYESFEMRCMVTGRNGVGKSSLVKLLVGDVIPEDTHPTDGISLLEGRCGIDVETKSWIYTDPETYDARDVVYNKVLMSSIDEDETQVATSEKKHISDKSITGRSDVDVIITSDFSRQSPKFTTPLSVHIDPSNQPLTETAIVHQKSFVLQTKRRQFGVTAKMTREEIRKKMEKILKSGKFKMKVGRLIFWDFGGQYVYYTTHQTFMTFRALFLVVFDGSKGLHEQICDVRCFPGQHITPTPAVFLQHWVNAILTYCQMVYIGIPKILFVATHKDKMPLESVETRRRLLYSGIEELFQNHEGRNHLVLDKQIFVNATDKKDPEIEVLKDTITNLIFDHPCWGEKMPNACVPLELEFAELAAEGIHILPLKEVEELNYISEVSALTHEQLKDFLLFHHSLGKIVYFDNPQLREYVIINPLFMVKVMQSFVTDKEFWPSERRMHETFEIMSESGIIQRKDLYRIWEQEDFRVILPFKEFIFNLLIHLDILAEQRRYDTTTGSRLPVENFFVPCMVTERNTTSFMEKECTPERAICLAFFFQETIIPPALPNRLISACLSMWTVKQYEGKTLLFSGFIGLSFDKAHDIVVCVEGNKILLYIVHRTSAGLIVPDIATGVKECLVVTLERISDFYQSTIHIKSSQQFPFHIEYSCSNMQCFINEIEALQTMEWVCDKHKHRHTIGTWLVWNQDQKKEQCELDCPGLSKDALNQIPSEIELLRFSTNCTLNQMHDLVVHLEMSKKWDELINNYPNNIAVAKFLVLSNWKEMKMKFKALHEALTIMEISTHVLCQVRRAKKTETDIPVEYLDFIPTDEILDALAPQIGQVFFQLGTEIGLSIATLENIQTNNPRDLAAQNREVLFTWKEDRIVKPTLQVLIQALVNIGRGVRCLEEVLKNVDLNTMVAIQKESDKGAIPKKRRTQPPLERQVSDKDAIQKKPGNKRTQTSKDSKTCAVA